MSAPRIEVLTPRGAGGVAVLAVRGSDRHRRVARLLRAPRGDQLVVTNTPRLALLCADGEVVDEVLVFDRPGRGWIEIHAHGSEAVLRALEVAAPEQAADPARALLLEALGEPQLALALEQIETPWDEFLARLRGLPAASRAVEVSAARERSRVALALARPLRVVLCGAQNAGKSTLMNRLLFRERVLTGDTPGLTRDPIRELTVLEGYPYELVDTAGEGEAPPGRVDREALARARRERDDPAAWRMLVVDASRGPSELDLALRDDRTLVVRNKIDLRPAAGTWPDELEPSVTTSCADPAMAGEVRAQVGAALRAARGLPPASAVGGPAALTAAQLALLDGI